MPFTDTWTAAEQANAVNLVGVPTIDRPVALLNTTYNGTSFDTGIMSVATYRTVAFVAWADKSNGTAAVGDNGDITITHYIGSVPVHVETLRVWTSAVATNGSLVFGYATRGRLWCRGDGIRVQGATGSSLDQWGLTLFGSFTETPGEEIIVGHAWQSAANGLTATADTQWQWSPNNGASMPNGTNYRVYPSGFRAGPAKLALYVPAGTSMDFMAFVESSVNKPIAGQLAYAPAVRTLQLYDVILPRAPVGLYFANNTGGAISAVVSVTMTQGVQG